MPSARGVVEFRCARCPEEGRLSEDHYQNASRHRHRLRALVELWIESHGDSDRSREQGGGSRTTNIRGRQGTMSTRTLTERRRKVEERGRKKGVVDRGFVGSISGHNPGNAAPFPQALSANCPCTQPAVLSARPQGARTEVARRKK